MLEGVVIFIVLLNNTELQSLGVVIPDKRARPTGFVVRGAVHVSSLSVVALQLERTEEYR